MSLQGSNVAYDFKEWGLASEEQRFDDAQLQFFESIGFWAHRPDESMRSVAIDRSNYLYRATGELLAGIVLHKTMSSHKRGMAAAIVLEEAEVGRRDAYRRFVPQAGIAEPPTSFERRAEGFTRQLRDGSDPELVTWGILRRYTQSFDRDTWTLDRYLTQVSADRQAKPSSNTQKVAGGVAIAATLAAVGWLAGRKA